MKVEWASLSDPGGRSRNEDNHGRLAVESVACWVVADGLGGHRGGQEASQTAVEAVLASFKARPELGGEALGGHLAAAQTAIHERQEADDELRSMHSTAALLVSDGVTAAWAHLGDTRVYRFREGTLAFQSKDHSVCQVLADTGEIKPEEIRFHDDRNKLLRCLGKAGQVRPALGESALEPGDAFLLCTDGFWEYVTEPEMAADQAAAGGPQEWLDRMLVRLRERATGEHDNYTATAVWYQE